MSLIAPLAAAALGITLAFADTAYFTAIEDVPLPAGFVETAGWNMAVEAGRLTEVRAEGPGEAERVRTYYIESLPQLGWSVSPQADQSLVFIRGRERLMFSFSEPAARRVLVRARLLVDAASTASD